MVLRQKARSKQSHRVALTEQHAELDRHKNELKLSLQNIEGSLNSWTAQTCEKKAIKFEIQVLTSRKAFCQSRRDQILDLKADLEEKALPQFSFELLENPQAKQAYDLRYVSNTINGTNPYDYPVLINSRHPMLNLEKRLEESKRNLLLKKERLDQLIFEMEELNTKRRQYQETLDSAQDELFVVKQDIKQLDYAVNNSNAINQLGSGISPPSWLTAYLRDNSESSLLIR